MLETWSVRRTRTSCSTSRQPKISFHIVVGSAIAFFSSWCSLCRWWWSSLLSVGFFFFFIFLLPWKFQLGPFCCLILLIFNLYYWLFCKSFICFQFYPSIPNCHYYFFSIWSLFFFISIVFLGHFVKFLLVFNFIIQSKFMVCHVFQFSPHSFDYFCHSVKVIVLLISPSNQKLIVVI